ncbi:MAG: PQQ-binding-like beta-propeller repeat protein, partial [Planctomycetaceae bacterium]
DDDTARRDRRAAAEAAAGFELPDGLARGRVEGGTFFAIDVATSVVAWQSRPAAGGPAYRSSAAVADGRGRVGSRGRAGEACSVADGARAGRRPMRGRVEASPAVVMARGPDAVAPRLVALVADASGRIAALDAATGEPVGEFEAGGGFGGGAAVAAGRVVIASDEGRVWCFRSADQADASR